MSQFIECPHCNEQIDVESALSHKMEAHYQDKLIKKENALLAQYEAEKKTSEAKLRETLKDQLSAEIKNEQEETLKTLKEKEAQIIEYRQNETTLLREKRKLQEAKETFELEMERKLEKERQQIREEVLKLEEEKYHMKLGDKEQHIANLKKTIEELQRKAEQGSMQSQGETQEIELENLLIHSFPFDKIEEVKKGVNGSDVIQHVFNSYGKKCGIISYESKRTKSFSDNWVEKLKGDMRNQGADIGIIVSEVLPTGMKTFGLCNGIWVCQFHEVEALSVILRDGLIRIADVKSSEEHKGEKMAILYDYLTSSEFQLQIQAIVEAFSSMKDDLDREKRAMSKLWKQREKQLDKVLLTTSEMHGSIRGIAGNAVQEVPELELDIKVISE